MKIVERIKGITSDWAKPGRWKSVRKKKPRVNPAMLPVWKMILGRLAQDLPEEAVFQWVDQFVLLGFTSRRITLLYTGGRDEAEFLGKYADDFQAAVYAVLEYPVQIQFLKKKAPPAPRAKKLPKRAALLALSVVLFVLAGFIAIVGSNAVQNLRFAETLYTVSSPKIFETIRVVQLSDLHNTTYGQDNSLLTDRIQKLRPDIIILSGDILEQNDASDEVTLRLCRRLAEIAPAYYIYGNDECTKDYGIKMTKEELDALAGNSDTNHSLSRLTSAGLRQSLEDTGVTVLQNETASVEVKGMQVDIYGVLTSNPSAFWPYAQESFARFTSTDTDHFKLFVCHEPYIFEEFPEGYWGDLILCGHSHGGIVRLPYLGGLYERKNGLFPERGQSPAYIAGKYTVLEHPLIVSRGLSNRGAVRISNQPELVIVDIGR